MQLTAAKRSISLGLQHPEDLPLAHAQHAGQVVAWRRARGLPITTPLHHTCQGRCSYRCSFFSNVPNHMAMTSVYAAVGCICSCVMCSKLGNHLFMCEQCGWAHLCGDACTERFMDLSSELPVCPISGRCFTRMMTWEEVCTRMYLWVTCGPCVLHEAFSQLVSSNCFDMISESSDDTSAGGERDGCERQ